jgi:uncharacterized protein (UPF0335 family)
MGGNGYDAERILRYVSRIEQLNRTKQVVRDDAADECKLINADIEAVFVEALEDHGIPSKALRSVIRARALEKKADGIRSGLKSDDQDSYDMIRLALGDLADTPLGEAVTSKFVPPDTSDTPF